MAKENYIQFKEQDLLSIPRSVFFVGITVGLFYAFFLYSFFYVCREAFRLFTVTEYYDLLILSPGEVFSYNLFFAFIATIMGQSACFLFWFDKPRHIFGKSQRRRVSMVNDQRNISWYFMYWFTTLIALLSFFFFLALPGGYHTISFFPNYLHVAVLIIIVLYLNNWITFRRAFKRKSKKWFLVSTLVIVGVSFLFAGINLVNYRKINENILKKNVYYTYQLEVPEVDDSLIRYTLEPRWNKSLTWQAFVVMKPEGDQAACPAIIVDNAIVTIEEYREKISEWQSEIPDYYIPLITIRLHVDRNVPMKIVDQLHQIHYDASHIELGYAVIPVEREFNERLYMYATVFSMVPENYNNRDSIQRVVIETDSISNIIKVDIDSHGRYSVDKTPVEKHDLRIIIGDKIRNDNRFLLVFSLDDNTPFGEYLFAWTEMLVALNEVRNEYAMKHYKTPFLQIYDFDLLMEIRNKLPYRMIQFIGD